MSTQATVSALSQPFDEALAYFQGKMRQPTERWTDLMREAHTRAFTVAGATSDALLKDFQGSIQKALEKGTTLAEFRRDFDRIVADHGWSHTGTAEWRSRVIYETNLNMAFSAGRYAQMSEPATKALYPYWQYVHSGARHPRIQHLNWNGKILAADDPWWGTHYPPNGWHCGCRVRPINQAGMRRMGRSEPDPSPDISYKPWRNPRTGQIESVPAGIDPGFDYNPGMAWKQPVESGGRIPAPKPPPPAPSAPPGGWRAEDFATPAKAAENLPQAQRRWAEGLSGDKQLAIETYRGDAGRVINAAMMGEIDIPELRILGATVQAAISTAEAPEAISLWRAIDGVAADKMEARTVGEEFVERGFTPTSLKPEVAARFLELADGGSLLLVKVPKGFRGAAYIHHLPKIMNDEYELLLKAGVRFRVVGRDTQTNAIILEAISG